MLIKQTTTTTTKRIIEVAMLRRITSSRLCCGCKISTIISYRTCSGAAINQKFLNVAVIGQPNSGKSTLVNRLVGNRVSAVTSIHHTTRASANGIITSGDTQLVFTDTPGAVSYQEGRRLKMHSNHIRTPSRVAGGADLLAVVTDAVDKRSKHYIHENVLNIMTEHKDIPSVLVINKVDRVLNKNELLPLTELLNSDRENNIEGGLQEVGGSSAFKETFFVSATMGDGIEQLLRYFLSQAKLAAWEYPEDIYCEGGYEAAVAEVFREKLMVIFGEEIPWQVKQETLNFGGNEVTRVARIHQKLTWPKVSQRRYVLTKEDELLKACLDELEKMFKCKVDLSMEISQKKKITKDEVYY